VKYKFYTTSLRRLDETCVWFSAVIPCKFCVDTSCLNRLRSIYPADHEQPLFYNSYRSDISVFLTYSCVTYDQEMLQPPRAAHRGFVELNLPLVAFQLIVEGYVATWWMLLWLYHTWRHVFRGWRSAKASVVPCANHLAVNISREYHLDVQSDYVVFLHFFLSATIRPNLHQNSLN